MSSDNHEMLILEDKDKNIHEDKDKEDKEDIKKNDNKEDANVQHINLPQLEQKQYDLVRKYSPHIMFHKDEVCFPISIDQYLQVCELNNQIPTSEYLYNCYQLQSANPIKFQNEQSQDRIKGSPDDAVCYAKIIETPNLYKLIYYYVFSHTEPYKCCYFGFPMYKYAHRGDIKFILVEVNKNDNKITRAYFGAHGSMAGVWRESKDIQFNGDHLVAYAACMDHSFYPESGMYPRIFFVAWDKCSNNIKCEPSTILNHVENDPLFAAHESGWNYYPGTMNDQGVNMPNNQGFWHADVPEVSNNWFKRLFCLDYF